MFSPSAALLISFSEMIVFNFKLYFIFPSENKETGRFVFVYKKRAVTT